MAPPLPFVQRLLRSINIGVFILAPNALIDRRQNV